MGTSFMGEPLKTYNQLLDKADAFMRNPGVKTGRALAKTGGILLSSAVLQAVVSAFISAFRKWDDDETLMEKTKKRLLGDYEGKDGWEIAKEVLFGNNLAEELNLINYIPFARDLSDAMQGFEVARDDMTVVSNLISAGETLVEGSGKKSTARNITAFAGALGDLLGVPVSNIMKEIEFAVNGGARALEAAGMDTLAVQEVLKLYREDIANESTQKSYAKFIYKAQQAGNTDVVEDVLKRYEQWMTTDSKGSEISMRVKMEQKVAAVELEDVTGSTKKTDGYAAYVEKVKAGEQEEAARILKALQTQGTSDMALSSAVKNLLMEEEDIQLAAQKWVDGDIGGSAEIRKQWREMGFEDDTVIAAINACANKIAGGSKYGVSAKDGEVPGTYRYQDLFTALEKGTDYVDEIMDDLNKQGKTAQSIRSALTGQFKPLYKELMGGTAADKQEAAEIRKRLLALNVGYAEKDFEKWMK